MSQQKETERVREIFDASAARYDRDMAFSEKLFLRLDCARRLPRGISVVDRLVGQGPEIEADVRWAGRRPGALGHQDGDHILPGV